MMRSAWLVAAFLVCGMVHGAAVETCPLAGTDVVAPRDGAQIYVDAAGSITLTFEAKPGCVAETEYVEFFLAPPGSATFTSIGRDTTYPYRKDYAFLGVTFGSPWTLKAVAMPLDTEADAPEVQSMFTFLAVDETNDAADNGLPDDPFGALTGPTDLWVAPGQFTNGAYALLAAAASMYGYTAEQDPYLAYTTVTLASAVNADQVLTVRAPLDLLEEGERGVLVVAMAPDAISLMGDVEADGPAGDAPDTALDPEAQYFHVSLLVSADNGASWAEIDTARLADYPLEAALTGLTLAGGEDYTLARYPATLAVSGSAVYIAAESGGWNSVTSQETDYELGSITANLVSTGLFAPFQQAEVSSSTTGTGDTALYMILSPILLALGILQLADGNGPCFIATAAYGTPMAGDIQVLRHFRDQALLNSAAGSLAVDAYYRLSPALADRVASSPVLASAVRTALLPVVWAVRAGMAFPAGIALAVGLLAVVRFRRRLASRRAGA